MGLDSERMTWIDQTISKIKAFTSGCSEKEKDMILDILMTSLTELKKNINIHK